MYSSQIAKYICLKLQNIFFTNCKICLFQIVKYICLKLQGSPIVRRNWQLLRALVALCINKTLPLRRTTCGSEHFETRKEGEICPFPVLINY